MSPGRDRGVAEMIYLTEQNFDEALVATQGLVDGGLPGRLVRLVPGDCADPRGTGQKASESRVRLMKVNVGDATRPPG